MSDKELAEIGDMDPAAPRVGGDTDLVGEKLATSENLAVSEKRDGENRAASEYLEISEYLAVSENLPKSTYLAVSENFSTSDSDDCDEDRCLLESLCRLDSPDSEDVFGFFLPECLCLDLVFRRFFL